MSYHKQYMKGLVKTLKLHRVPSEITFDAIEGFLQSLNCPRALTVYMLYTAGEHEQLTKLEVNVENYENFSAFRDAYSATKFLSKASFLNLPYDLDDVAFQKFDQFELLCKQTNSRFRNLALDPLFKGPNVWLLNAVTRKIATLLGEFDVEEMLDLANWGPGSTTSIGGVDTSSVNKFQYETGTTRDLYDLLPLDGLPIHYNGWQRHLKSSRYPVFYEGNKVITVPKDSKANRVIAIEPGINLWFQLGIGKMIRRRLFRHGIDLNTQEVNQSLARVGSKNRHLATVDFSSASDSIARELVREILPPDWYRVLDASRSHFGKRNGDFTRWEKFSSMGNGFTFELESLIFFAAAKAVEEYLGFPKGSKISVYGDDVILPCTCYELFSSFCAFLGFVVNSDKSYSVGAFRESCGKHYYDGVDVSPIFLKDIASDVLAVYRLANSVRELAHRRNSGSFFDDQSFGYRIQTAGYGCDLVLKHCWDRLYQSVPKALRLRIPFGKGDGGFISNFDESTPVKAKHGIEGYMYKAFTKVGVTRQSDGDGLLFARLRNSSVQEHGNNYVLRGRTRLRLTLSLARRWYDLGPWI